MANEGSIEMNCCRNIKSVRPNIEWISGHLISHTEFAEVGVEGGRGPIDRIPLICLLLSIMLMVIRISYSCILPSIYCLENNLKRAQVMSLKLNVQNEIVWFSENRSFNNAENDFKTILPSPSAGLALSALVSDYDLVLFVYVLS